MLKLWALLATSFLSLAATQDAIDCSSDIVVKSQSDVDNIRGCSVFTGKITIETNGVIDINGVKSIASLEAVNTNLTMLIASDLAEITDTLHLQGLQNLVTLNMYMLTSVGSLHLQDLPQLTELMFYNGIQKAQEVVISKTYLQSLSGINISNTATFNINNNKNLTSITVGITSVSDVLDISYNGACNAQGVKVSFPTLQWASRATFRSCGSVNAPNLRTVNTSLGFFNNTLTDLNFNILDKVGNLSIVGNDRLANISLYGIKEISGALIVANNSKLGSVTGFPNAQVARGPVTIQGNFTQASMPSLYYVDGDVYIESNEDFDCKDFNNAHSSGDFFGSKYVCEGASSTVSVDINTSTQTYPEGFSASVAGSGPSRSENNAAGSGSIVGLAAILLSLF